MDNRSALALIFWIFASVLCLIVSFLVARSRTPIGPRFVLLGIVFGLVALWYGFIGGLTPTNGPPIPLPNGSFGETALRLAAVLILGGIVVSVLSPAVPVAPPEVPRNVPPNA
jgi:hypothetical protein